MQRHLKGGSAGFNLIELMLVVAIIGIVVAAAVPSFASRSAWYRMDGAAKDMASRISWARQKAVSSRTPYRMLIDRAGMAYSFERQDTDSTWTPDPPDSFRITGIDDFEAEIAGDVGDEELLFETQGTINDDDAPAVFRFYSTKGDTCALNLVRTGRITTTSWAAN